MGGAVSFKIDRDFKLGPGSIPCLTQLRSLPGHATNWHEGQFCIEPVPFYTEPIPFIRKRFKKGARFLPNAPKKKNGKKIAWNFYRFSHYSLPSVTWNNFTKHHAHNESKRLTISSFQKSDAPETGNRHLIKHWTSWHCAPLPTDDPANLVTYGPLC